MVWKSKQPRDSLGCCLFAERNLAGPTWSTNAHKATQPVPETKTPAVNLMARCWDSVSDIHKIEILVETKTTARKWASILVKLFGDDKTLKSGLLS